LEVSFHRFGDAKHSNLDGVKMDTSDIENGGGVKTVPVSEDAFIFSRRLLDLAVGRDLRSLFDRVKARLRKISIPAFDRDGVWRISYAAVDAAEQIMLDAQAELEPLKFAFRVAYDAEVQKMRELQHEKFNPKDYPSAYDAAERWGMDWAYLETATVPKALGGVSEFIYQRAMQTAQKRANEAVAAVEQTLRAGLLACVERMKTDLTATTKLGRPRAYRADALERVTTFFQNFPLRNFINDGVCGEAMTEMSALLKNIPSADALDDEFLRLEVVQGLASIADTVRPFVGDAATRSVIVPESD
jgi:hypothetical protein